MGRSKRTVVWLDLGKAPATEAQRFFVLSDAIFPIYGKIMKPSGIQSV